MNLAICSAGELFGGVERQILDLCRFRVSRGFGRPAVVLFHDAELADRLRGEGVEPVVLRGRGRYDPGLVDALAALLRERGARVVHAHGYKATIACALAKGRTPFGLVKTEHGKVEASPGNPLSWLKSRLNFQAEQLLTRRHVDRVCYVTDDIGRWFASRHRGLDRRTIHNGMEPLALEGRPRPDDLPPGYFHIGIVGRISAVKGIPVAIEAMKRLRAPAGVRLDIIGTGRLAERLEASVRNTPLAERVRFLGFRRNVHDYLACLDVLLMPSFHEGLPYTLLEGMSLARPVVASRVGGLQEVVRDGETGLLCPAGQAGPLADCLDRLIEDPELAGRLGRNARREQIRNFTLDGMGEKYEAVYREVLPPGEKGAAHG